MKLGGQGERGYAMATLLVGMGLMSIFMSAALPAWSQMAQREKEAEYLFRANQYALAVSRCRMKQCGANGVAPSVDFLVEQKFLRKRYKDPFTDKDFVPVLRNQALPGVNQQPNQGGSQFGQPPQSGQQPGQQGPSGQQGQSQQSSLATAKSLATDTLKISASDGGSDTPRPLTGVTSASKETALRLFKGQMTTYDQWVVTAEDLGLRLAGRSVGSRFVQAGGTGTNSNPNQNGTNPFGNGATGGTGGFGSGGQGGFGSGTGGFGSGPGGFGSGTSGPGGPGGFGQPNQQGTPVFPPPPSGGGTASPPSPQFGRPPQ